MIVKTQTELNKGETKIVFDVAYGLKMIELFRNEFPDIFRLVVFVMSDDQTRASNIQKEWVRNQPAKLKKNCISGMIFAYCWSR